MRHANPIRVPGLTELNISFNGRVIDNDGCEIPVFTKDYLKQLYYDGKWYPIYHLMGRSWSHEEETTYSKSPYKKIIEQYSKHVLYPVPTYPLYASDPSGNLLLVNLIRWRKVDMLCHGSIQDEGYQRIRRIVIGTYVHWNVNREEYIKGFFGEDIDEYMKFLHEDTLV